MASTPLDQALSLIDAGRFDEGVHMLRQVASTGDPQGLFMLASFTWGGRHVQQDPARGRLLYEYAASLGHPQGNLFLTNLLGNGVAGKRDWELALARLEAEARQLPGRRAALDLVRAMDLDANGDPRSVPQPRLISKEPDARLFAGAFTPQECAYLIEGVRDMFEPSMVYNAARELVRDTIRTSDGATYHWLIEDPAVHSINRRVAALSGTSFEQGEALQVLRYVPGQEYRPHFDYVGGDEVSRRVWTALIYLNDDYDGGATAFVRTGTEVQGRTGDVLLFRNDLADGAQDPLSEHAGLPVTRGSKYLATRWVRGGRWIP
jgi:prolyl 4-hydroxylase